ncbi:MAG TPA: type II toxin-antitoxin system RelE/ParE family toxin [Stellaceae bacterium]|nr:type II toxin-antitoxin system RelE/ParE family toxin [Stellaceae bacterium]
MKLRFTPRATENLTHIADFIRTENPAAAEAVRNAVYDSLQLLLLFPQLGRAEATDGVRKLVTRRFAYMVYYLVDRAAEEIVS